MFPLCPHQEHCSCSHQAQCVCHGSQQVWCVRSHCPTGVRSGSVDLFLSGAVCPFPPSVRSHQASVPTKRPFSPSVRSHQINGRYAPTVCMGAEVRLQLQHANAFLHVPVLQASSSPKCSHPHNSPPADPSKPTRVSIHLAFNRSQML